MAYATTKTTNIATSHRYSKYKLFFDLDCHCERTIESAGSWSKPQLFNFNSLLHVFNNLFGMMWWWWWCWRRSWCFIELKSCIYADHEQQWKMSIRSATILYWCVDVWTLQSAICVAISSVVFLFLFLSVCKREKKVFYQLNMILSNELARHNHKLRSI